MRSLTTTKIPATLIVTLSRPAASNKRPVQTEGYSFPVHNFMKSKLTLLALFCCAFSVLAAPVPPAEKLLPPDAFFFATIPDAAKWRTILTDSPQVQLWRDDAMRPFKEKFLAKLRSEVLAPLERKLNLKLSDYEEIAQGQVTLAVVPNTPATDR